MLGPDGKPMMQNVQKIDGNMLIQQFIGTLSSRIMYSMLIKVFTPDEFKKIWNKITISESETFFKAIIPMIQGDIAGVASLRKAIDNVCVGMGAEILSNYEATVSEDPGGSKE